ncbi:hypothetical protein [Clostridium cadaveris]|uniref:hypothetical protein n=1 Tax=Clostridium cadaveris TaxID=1529 RepID=UPI000411F29E|nr:hypothetical protein [Clostridium cadaveris]MDM8313617.1 hypothetical protein [Clostridium cadaveris]
MKERIITKVTSAKWLIAVILTMVFSYCIIVGRDVKEFLPIYSGVVMFYFGNSVSKKVKSE